MSDAEILAFLRLAWPDFLIGLCTLVALVGLLALWYNLPDGVKWRLQEAVEFVLRWVAITACGLLAIAFVVFCLVVVGVLVLLLGVLARALFLGILLVFGLS